MPSALKLAMGGARGRGLVATRRFEPGALVFKERPIVLFDTERAAAGEPSVHHITPTARKLSARLPLEKLRRHCAEHGIRYPLVVADMAIKSLCTPPCSVLTEPFKEFWTRVNYLHRTPAPRPLPARWSAEHALLRDAFCSPQASVDGANALFADEGQFGLDWYARTLSTLHGNLMRVSDSEIALFECASMLNHDCQHNLLFSFETGGTVARFIARKPIEVRPRAQRAERPRRRRRRRVARRRARPPATARPRRARARPRAARGARWQEGEELTITYVSPLAVVSPQQQRQRAAGGAAPASAAGPDDELLAPSPEQRAALRLAYGFDCDSCGCARRAETLAAAAALEAAPSGSAAGATAEAPATPIHAVQTPTPPFPLGAPTPPPPPSAPMAAA